MSEWFSVAALLIMFREALEAAVIIAVLLQMLSKMKMPELKKWVWFGALTGLGISIIIGTVFILVFYLANTKLMSENASYIFKGCICWIASALIVVVAFAMLRFYNMERKWRHKLQGAVDRTAHAKSYRWSMFFLAGSATLREGIESVLFLTGVSAGASVKAVIIPGLIGILLGGILGVLVYYTGHSIKSLKWFFIVSASILLFVAAGMVANGTGFFQYAGLFGIMYPYEWRPWSNLIVWDVSGCCDPNTNDFWSLMRALFGWQAQPTNLQLLYYFLFWGITLSLFSWKLYHGTLTDRREAAIDDLKSMARINLEGREGAPSCDTLDGSSSDGLPSGKDCASSDDLETGLGETVSNRNVDNGDANIDPGVPVPQPAARATSEKAEQ